MVKQIYKNIYYDEKTGKYYFYDGKDKREVVNQEAYILIYILENIVGGKQNAMRK